MDIPLFPPSTTVAEALKAGGPVSRVFLRNQTACTGCYLAHFCSLEDVANTYGLALEPFLDEIQRAAHSHHSILIGAKYE